MTTGAAGPVRPAAGTTTLQKVGIVLCVLHGLSNASSVLFPTPDGEEGPPYAILLVDTVLGVVAVVAAVLAWRGHAVALRVAAVTTMLIGLTALPAFFVDVPAAIKAVSAFGVVLAVLIVALLLSGTRRTTVPGSS